MEPQQVYCWSHRFIELAPSVGALNPTDTLLEHLRGEISMLNTKETIRHSHLGELNRTGFVGGLFP